MGPSTWGKRWGMIITEKLKSLYRGTPLYTSRFARINAARNDQRSPDDETLRSLYSQFVSDGDLVFDIGANTGEHTKLFLDLGCRVVAVEPQRNCVAALRRSFGGKLDIVQSAVSDYIGMATLKKHDTLHAMATLSDEWLLRSDKAGEWFRRERVGTTTFDVLITRFGTPKFAKIDVEGSERKLFAGLSSAIETIRFEHACELIGDTKACIAKLATLGRYEYNYTPSYSTVLQPDWMLEQEFVSFLPGAKWGDIFARLLS
jgi:FkbM family methyltransferase